MKEIEDGPLKEFANKMYIRIITDGGDEDESFATERYAKYVKHGGNVTFADLGQESMFVSL